MPRRATIDDGDIWFDRWLRADGKLRPVVNDLVDCLRANRGRDVQAHRVGVFEASVSALIANLAGLASETQDGWMAVHLDTKGKAGLSRYGCPEVPTITLKKLLEAAEEDGFILRRQGRRGVATTIKPTSRLLVALEAAKADEADIVRREGEELIILSRRTLSELGAEGTARTVQTSERVPYEDTPETVAMRKDVQVINTALASASLSFEDDGKSPKVNTSKRSLKRHFNLLPDQPVGVPRFDQGGRLFGAFWSNLDRDRRRSSLRIDGEKIAEVDFSAMFTRLAYAKAGLTLSDDDPYKHIAEELKAERGTVKKAINALFFSEGLLQRWPDEIRDAFDKDGQRVPSVRSVTSVVLRDLPGLNGFLGSRCGYGFMRTESDILVAGLKTLIRKGITALPLHDAVLVAASKGQRTQRVLEDTAHCLTGVRLPAGLKIQP